MKNYTIQYKNYIVTENSTIRNSGFSIITFENIGESEIEINGNIPLGFGLSRSFGDRPNCVIDTIFNINFKDNTKEKKLLVVEAYFKEVK